MLSHATESEESDGEGGLGNLNRVVVRPLGHSGKAKKGHLCFDAAFESGNLGRADHVTELEYDLFVRPDTCRPSSRFCFNFTVENVKQDQRVIFNFVNFGKAHTLFAMEMTPLVRSTSRPKWQRIPRRHTFYHRSSQHRGRHVLSVAFAFDREDDVFHFATAAPYSYSRLQRYLALWEKRTVGFAVREQLALSTQKRRVDLLTICEQGPGAAGAGAGAAAGRRGGGGGRRVVVVLARTHGGEAPASHVCQGLLDFLASCHDSAKALRQGVTVKVIPMLNPDGVFLGSQRSDLLGSDLNRAWHRATSYAHPALVATSDMLRQICEDKSHQLDFILDIHAHNSKDGIFLYGNSYEDVYRFERHAVLPKFMSARVEAWRADHCMFNCDAGKAGSARRSLAPAARADAYSLMVSLGGRRLGARGTYLHYTDDAYSRVGRALGKSLCDYYRHVGVLAAGATGAGRARRARGLRARRRRVPRRRPAESSDSSPERRPLRCVAPRTMSPPLPPLASSPPRPARPARTARRQACREPVVPLITGFCLRAPRLAVLDLSAAVRAPGAAPPPPPRLTSDEYSTQTDSD